MADYEYLNNSGVILPDTSDLLTEVQEEFRAAFGADLIVDPSTPQGVLITAEVLARDSVIRNNAALANQINPDIAGGVFLDAIGGLTEFERDKATRSYVLADVEGVSGTIIPQGSRAKTSAEDIFETTDAVLIGVGGTAQVTFQSVEFGPIPAPIEALNQIVDAILGWETVSNPQSAIVGQLVQSDQSYRALRKLTLAGQGISLVEAQISDLYKVPEVRSLTFRENVTDSTQTIDEVSMVAHSVYACVDGGTDQDIAASLLENKSAGANWNGGVTVNVVEPASGQSYAVKFSRPTVIDIFAEVTVKVNTSLIDPQSAVRNAILQYANGELDGERGLVVGASVSAFEFSGAINRYAPGIYVQDLQIKKSGGTFSNEEIPIKIFEIAKITGSSITVNVV